MGRGAVRQGSARVDSCLRRNGKGEGARIRIECGTTKGARSRVRGEALGDGLGLELGLGGLPIREEAGDSFVG